MARSCLLTVLVLMVALAGASASNRPAEIEHRPILDIVVRADGLQDTSGLISVLGLEPGRPVDRLLLRRGIQTLVASGEVSRVRVQRELLDDGVVVHIELDFVPRLTDVKLDVPSLYWRFWVPRWFDIDVGDQVNADRIAQTARRTERRMIDRGFPDARVQPYLSYDGSSNSATLTVVVRPGEPDLIAGVSLEGLPDGVQGDQVWRRRLDGKKVRAALLAEIRDGVESALRGLGYWQARVAEIESRDTGDGTWLVVHVEPGPVFELELRAPETLMDDVRRVLPDPTDEDMHADQTDVLTERVLEGLHEAGWPVAKAQVLVESPTPDRRRVRVEVEPGPTLKVTEVVFPGAKSMRPKVLQKAVAVKPGFGGRRKPVTSERLEKDRVALLDTYRTRGFLDAELGQPRVVRLADDGLAVEFPVEEGIQWTVDRFRVEGVPVEAMWAADKDRFQLEVTEAWDPRKVDVLIGRWQRAMADSGYPEATMTAQVETPQPGRVRVALWAQPGDFVRFGRIVIAGLNATNRSVVERMIDHAGLRSGNPYSQETIIRAQQELYRLGIFKLVAIVPIPGHERRVERSVVVQLEEGMQRSYLIGLGWATEDRFRTTLGWTHLNLAGGAHALSIQTRYSAREFRYQLSLNEPLLPVLRRPGFFAAYQTDEQFADFDQRRRGLWFEIGDRLKAPFRNWVRYEYQVVKPNAPADILSDLERDQQEIQLSSVTPTFEWDFRNDLLNPTSGTLVSFAPEYAFPAFSAEAEFVKIRAGVSHYVQVPDGRLAIGLRAGAIWPFGVDSARPENLQVPLAVRFFSGGSASHRAFATDRLGIPGETIAEDGTPIGGNGLLLVNIEYIRPIWRELAATLFVDGGNVWAEPRDINLSDLRWGVGVGVRFETPAGPFRLEYGRKIDALEGEANGELFFSFGVAF